VSSNRKREYGLEPRSGDLVRFPERQSMQPNHVKAVIGRTMFPEGGRDAVSEDYWGFSIWCFVKSAVSASTSVLGTQGLLRAVGIGANASVASSAAINWVLKDGLGRVGCILAASVIGNKFDNDAKLFVFLGDMMYEVGIFLEILAPLCAHAFLVVASMANAFKSMSYMSRLPPRAAILKSFAMRENVGDVSAKANSQDVVSGLFGLLLGIQVSFFVGSSIWKSLVVFLVSSVIVGISSLKALSDLRLNTLNRHRMEIILDSFVQQQQEGEEEGERRAGGEMNGIPSPRSVNKQEGALRTWTRVFKRNDFSTVFGASLENIRKEEGNKTNQYEGLGDLIEHYKGEEYLIHLQPSKNKKKMTALLFVQPNISAQSIICALLQVAYMKKRFLQVRAKGDKYYRDFDPVAEAKTAFALSKSAFPALFEGMKQQGWFTKHVLWIPKNILSFQPKRKDQKPKKTNSLEEEQGEEEASSWQNASQTVLVQSETRDTTCNSPVCETPAIVEVSSEATAED
jgi:hypothetical protein